MDEQAIQNLIKVVGEVLTERCKPPLPSKAYSVTSNIKSLDHLMDLLKQHEEIKVSVSKLDSQLVKYLDRDYYDTDDDIDDGRFHDIRDIPEGEIKFVYYESSGQGGSSFITLRFNHKGTLVDVDWCSFAPLEFGLTNPGTICDADLTFSLVK